MRGLGVPIAAVLLLACGDDGSGADTGQITGASATMMPTGSETGADGSSSGAATSAGTGGTTSSGVDSSSGADSSGGLEDPNYPAPVGPGACPMDTAFVDLVTAAACAPFCAGAGAMCPAGASGNAAAECTPFEQAGGSGDPCTDHAECPAGEGCSLQGMCVSVAFWGCRLLCPGARSCPDGMVCAAVGACGYPV